MPTGSPRPNGGPPLGSRNNPHGRRGKPKTDAAAPTADRPRPKFESGRDFALWVLNAADDEAPMEVKVRAMQALISRRSQPRRMISRRSTRPGRCASSAW